MSPATRDRTLPWIDCRPAEGESADRTYRALVDRDPASFEDRFWVAQLESWARESFSQPSRDLVGQFHGRTIGGAWRHFLTPRVGFEVAHTHQNRSDDTHQDSYSLRLVRRW